MPCILVSCRYRDILRVELWSQGSPFRGPSFLAMCVAGHRTQGPVDSIYDYFRRTLHPIEAVWHVEKGVNAPSWIESGKQFARHSKRLQQIPSLLLHCVVKILSIFS